MPKNIKKVKNILCTVVLLLMCISLNAKGTSFIQKIGEDVVKVEFYSPSIVRIIKAPNALPEKKSYSITMKEGEGMKETISRKESDNILYFSSSVICVEMNTENGEIKGNYKGMLTSRTFRIVLLNKDSGRGDQPMKENKTVTYNGKEINVKL